MAEGKNDGGDIPGLTKFEVGRLSNEYPTTLVLTLHATENNKLTVNCSAENLAWLAKACASETDGQSGPMGASAMIYAAPIQIKGAIGSRWLAMTLASLKVNLPPNNARLVITPEMPGR